MKERMPSDTAFVGILGLLVIALVFWAVIMSVWSLF
jgi:hypothetical protein